MRRACSSRRAGGRSCSTRRSRTGSHARLGRGRRAGFDQEFRNVEANAARADDRDLGAGRDPAFQHVEVADDLWMVMAFDVHRARGDAGGDHHLVETGEAIRIDPGGQFQGDAGVVDALAEVAQGLVEFFLARDRPSRSRATTP